jgi:NADP-dependent 3-hydroxy acid dehydrogenase YdfG
VSLADYKSVLVTGASSGIGEATVRALAPHGLEIHALARRRDRLEKLSDETGCRVHAIDLRDVDALYEVFGSLEVDVLINNAGVARGFAGFLNTSREDIDMGLETNLQSLLHLLRIAVPGMVERRRGHVINIGSVSGLYPLRSTLYGASKAAVHMLSQTLRLEIKGSGVRVTEICPGRVDTEAVAAAIDDPAIRAQAAHTGIQELESDDIAAAVLYALDAPWRVNVSMIEITPTEQVFGGFEFTPVPS